MRTCGVVTTALILLLAACAPSAEAVQTAIVATQLAAATEAPTHTPAPTGTPTAPPTPTPDLRVLMIDPRELMLSAEDLPPEGKYILPGQDWAGVLHNQKIINQWGAEEATKYLNATGRVDGWWVDYLRTSSKAAVPEEVYNNVVLYQSAHGAQVALKDYASRNMEDFTELTDITQAGDTARAFVLKKGGKVEFDYYFTYRNIQHVVILYGLESEATEAFALRTAEVLIGKMKTAPLDLP